MADASSWFTKRAIMELRSFWRACQPCPTCRGCVAHGGKSCLQGQKPVPYIKLLCKQWRWKQNEGNIHKVLGWLVVGAV